MVIKQAVTDSFQVNITSGWPLRIQEKHIEVTGTVSGRGTKAFTEGKVVLSDCRYF